MKSIFSALFLLLCTAVSFGTVYEVGPGKPYARIIDCPTHNLSAGDIIYVYYKSTPYREKFLLHGVGTAANPIKLVGVADAQGRLPILDGQNAVSSTAVSYWNEDRQIIKVGQNSNYLSDHIIIKGFVLRNANGNNTYTGDGGNTRSYASNACAIRPEYCTNITVSNCEIYNNGNGLFNGAGTPQHFVVSGCYIHDNGVVTPNDYHHHNIYMGVGGPGSRVTIQRCRFGEMANDGQQCKFRSETLVFRYNWVEGGRNSQLDIVEDTSNGRSDAYVYGNVIIKPADTHNSRMVHFGGDQSGSARNGTLYFFNNTCILHAVANTISLFQVSRTGSNIVADNNIFYKTSSSPMKTWRTYPNISGSNNWLHQGTQYADLFQNSITGTAPGFTDPSGQDYSLTGASPCLQAAGNYTFPAGHSLNYQYVRHLQVEARTMPGGLDLGAFERMSGSTTPGIFLTAPNGGEVWTAGNTHQVSWTSTGSISTVDLEYSSAGTGGTFVSIAQGVTNSGSYQWTVPPVDSAQCVVRINDSGGSASDTGDAVFTIRPAPSVTVTSPNGGELWTAGVPETITWDFSNMSGGVSIQLYKADAAVANLVSPPAEDLAYQWNIPVNTAPGDDYSIRISQDNTEDYSDNHFSIAAPYAHRPHPDINGDGRVDILWRYYGAGGGQNVVWYMNGVSRTGAAYLPRLGDTGWTIAGSGDFNGDGNTDILWRYTADNVNRGKNAVWFMTGVTRTGVAMLPRLSSLDWKITDTGDFNGDGKPDILWRCTAAGGTQGRNVVWTMDGVTRTGAAYLPGVSNLEWHLVGTGDFNGDGSTDILWRYTADGASRGQNVVWFMNGITRTGVATLPRLTGLDWKVEDVADFNGDGAPDILWRNHGNGADRGKIAAWFMDGVTRTGVGNLPTSADLNWKIEN